MQEVLFHHAEVTKRNIEESKSHPNGIEGALIDDLDRLGRKHRRDGTLKYPFLHEPDKRELFAKANKEVISVVLAGEYEVIPDFNIDGSQNFDPICRSCGNYDPSKTICDLTPRIGPLLGLLGAGILIATGNGRLIKDMIKRVSR